MLASRHSSLGKQNSTTYNLALTPRHRTRFRTCFTPDARHFSALLVHAAAARRIANAAVVSATSRVFPSPVTNNPSAASDALSAHTHIVMKPQTSCAFRACPTNIFVDAYAVRHHLGALVPADSSHVRTQSSRVRRLHTCARRCSATLRGRCSMVDARHKRTR